MNATPDQSPTGPPPGEPPEGGSRNPWIIGGAVVGIAVLAVVLFLALRPDDESAPTAATAPTATTTTQETTTEVTTSVETTTEESTTTEPDDQTQRIVVEVDANAEPVGGIKQAQVTQDDRVELLVRSAVADEIHLHGYNLSQDVAPGQPARITFRADIAGVFEAELEERAVQVLELTVSP
jgi:hypothetical protein